MAMFRFINSDEFITKCQNLEWAITQDDDVYIKYNVVGFGKYVLKIIVD